MSPHFYRVVKQVYGYKNVKAFYAGFPTWQKTGRPVYTEPEFLKMLMDDKGAYVLVDLREPSVAAKNHIPGAVNYPMSELKELYNELPKDKKKTRIIYYSDNDHDARIAHRTMRINGYDKGYILKGGIQEWMYKGYPVTHNQLAEDINYKYKLLPGVVDDKEFKQVMQGLATGKVKAKAILDVRSAKEFMGGHVPGAVNIPVDTLDNRWSELPRDKEYLVHCKAGNRARMGYMILRDKGYKVRYLDAKILFNKDNTLKKLKMRFN